MCVFCDGIQAGSFSEEGPGDVLEVEATMTIGTTWDQAAAKMKQQHEPACSVCGHVEGVTDPFVTASGISAHWRCVSEDQLEILQSPLSVETERRLVMENLNVDPYELLATFEGMELS